MNWTVFNTALIPLLWVKVLFLSKNVDFLPKKKKKKMLTSGKLAESWYYNMYFLKLHMFVCVLKYQISRS